MRDTVSVRGVARNIAEVGEFSLSTPEEDARSLTRRIFRPAIHDAAPGSVETVRGHIIHQRRRSTQGPWEDSVGFNLATLKAGEEVRLELKSSQVRRLYEALKVCYELPIGEWRVQNQKEYRVIDADAMVLTDWQKTMVEQFSHDDGVQFWDAIEQLNPGLLEAVSLKKEYERKKAIVEQFEAEIANDRWNEPRWQKFFEDHTWIFGHNLAFQFLHLLEAQPAYGGVELSGFGGQRGDFAMMTAGFHGFTVLVDIKTPDTKLTTDKLYRNKVYELAHDLVGGVAQLQSNCHTWYTSGSRTPENLENLKDAHINTYQPKGILVIGKTSSLNNMHKRSTFELYRRNLLNPEVLTFDELLARAKHTVSALEKQVKKDPYEDPPF